MDPATQPPAVNEKKAPALPATSGTFLPSLGSLRDAVDRLFDQFTTRVWDRPFDIAHGFRFETALGMALPAVHVAENVVYLVTGQRPAEITELS